MTTNPNNHGQAYRLLVVLISVALVLSPSSASLLADDDLGGPETEDVVAEGVVAEDEEAGDFVAVGVVAEDEEAGDFVAEGVVAEDEEAGDFVAVGVVAEDEEAGDFVAEGVVSGVVWVDTDGDGIRTEDEAPLSGVELTLTTTTGAVATATSDDDGLYELTEVAPGEYRLEAPVPDGYAVSPIPDGDHDVVNAFTAVDDPARTEPFGVAGDTVTFNLGLTVIDEDADTTSIDTTTEEESEETEDPTITTQPPQGDDDTVGDVALDSGGPDIGPLFAALAETLVIACETDAAVFNTAYDGEGGTLLPGSRDLLWQVGLGNASGPSSVSAWEEAYVVGRVVTAWAPSPFANADWISFNATAVHLGSIDMYLRFEFEISPVVDLEVFQLPVDFYVDNSIHEIWINGEAQSGNVAGLPQNPGNPYFHNGFGAGNQASLILSEGWQFGSNELIARIPSGPDRVGLMAQFRPEPLCPPTDFGDAPSSYGTLWADNGPRHGLLDYDSATNTASLMLGTQVSDDTDGQPSVGADADSFDDGVVDPIVLIIGQATEVEVVVTNNTGEPATLAGWIDLDDDGVFDPDELQWVVVPADSGTTAVPLTFPPASLPGDGTYARFRLFPGEVDEADLSPTGPASGGEVEDYPAVGPVAIFLQCPNVYAQQGGSPYSLYEVDTSTGAMTIVGQFASGTGTANGLGVSADARYLFSHRNGQVLRYDTHNGVTETFAGQPGLTATHGGVDPSSGIYYYGNTSNVYAFDPATAASLGHVATLSYDQAPAGANGDWSFDAQGNMYLVAGSTTSSSLYVVSGLPTTVQAPAVAVTGQRITTFTTSGAAVNGIAFDATGSLYAASNAVIFEINPSTGAIISSQSLTPSGVSVDLASCSSPASIVVQKDIVSRFYPGDQFEVTVTGGGISQNNVGTTTGTDTGPQTGAGEFAGPVLGLPGVTYDISETGASGADLATYTTSWVCVDQAAGGAEVASGDGTSGSFVMPQSVDGTGAAIVCTFTNEPLPLDFGDAPDTYGTTLAADGPRHGLPDFDPATNTSSLMLGASVDDEVDGQPSAGADGDSGDDGVDINPGIPGPAMIVQAGATNTAEVEVTGDGFMSAWVDLDQDGEFGPGEIVFDDEPVSDGLNTLSFSVPITVAHGETYLRVRLASQQGVANGPTGAAPDGEVEDYLVHVTAPVTEACGAGLINPGFEEPAVNGPTPFIQQFSSGRIKTYHENVVPGWSFVAADPTSGANDAQRNAIEIWRTTNPRAHEGNQFAEINAYVFGYLYQDMHTVPGSILTWSFAHRGRAGVDTIALNIGAPGATVEQTQESTGNTAWEVYTGLYMVPAGQFITRFEFEAIASATGSPAAGNFLDAITFGIECATDFGDAPDSYGTSRAADGARHQISSYDDAAHTSDLMLGAAVDAEPDGFPGVLAQGDDDDQIDDEDGVAEPIEVTGGQPTTVDVTVTNLTGGVATLAGWIDLDNDGTFDPGELVTVPVPNGTNGGTVQLVFPAGNPTADTYARFRLFPGVPDEILPTGPALGGEVEDYPVAVALVHFEKTVTPDDVAVLQPGVPFTYTVTVTNVGTVPLVDLSFTDDLSQVLDDATYNGDVTVVSGPGTAVFNSPDEISWDLDGGTLGVGEQAVVEFSVTIDDPPGGDAILANAVVGTGPGSNCVDNPSTDPDCFKEIPQPLLEGVKTSDVAGTVEPGQVVEYTFTVANVGPGRALNAVVWDDLSDVLDDASYNADAVLSPPGQGQVSFDAANRRLVWNGPLDAAGDPLDQVTITYTVTVNDVDHLDEGSLRNALLMSGCPYPPIYDPTDPDYDPNCVVVNDVAAWTAQKTSDASFPVLPGDVVTYTITVENVGNAPLTAAEVVNVDDLSEVLDDASYNDDADDGGHPGTFTFSDPTLTWSGDLAVGETVTLTYSVTVNDATDLGDGQLLNAITGSANCPAPAITDPQHPDFDSDCVDVQDVAAWTAHKTSDASFPVLPGDVVTYTITVANTGNVLLTAADVVNVDDLSEVLDDASYNNDADDGGHPGTFTFSDPTLRWSGDLDVGETVTLAYSVTINEAKELGDGQLVNAITGSANCPDPAIVDPADPDCVAIAFIEAWAVSKTPDPAGMIGPGGTVVYTVVAVNTGGVDLAGIGWDDDLTAVLDDAVFNNDEVVVDGPGAVDYTEPVVSWEGDLTVGQSATVTYSVTVNEAGELGDGVLENAVTGGDCPEVGAPPECSTTAPVAAYTVVKSTVAPDPAVPGDTVLYTVTVTNTGGTDLVGAAAAVFSDDLSGVLDDATLNQGSIAADVGTATYSEPALSWSGDLLVGAVATVTYSVTVNQPIGGDHLLMNAVTGGDCPDPAVTDPQHPGFDGSCVTVTPLPGVHIRKVVFGAPVEDLRPGDSFEYVVTVENIGEVDLVDESFTDDLSEVLDDATLDEGSITADIGDATFDAAAEELTWVGDLDIGEIATVRYSVTINDPLTGDGEVRNGVVGPVYSNCVPPDADNPHCWEETPVPNIYVGKERVDPANPQPGDVVTYRITIENRGGADATAEEVSDDLSGVLDDALYNNDAAATSGTVSYAEPVLSWVGTVPAGATVTVTYSVTVNDYADLGDAILDNTVTGGENCPVDTESCTTEDPLPTYAAAKSVVSPSQVAPGDTVTYQVTITNTSAVTAESAEITDDLSGVLDDATYNGDATATSGSVFYQEPTLTWTGSLPAGGVVTVTYSVRVNAAEALGDGNLVNTVSAPNCPDPECVTSTPLPAVLYHKRVISPTGVIRGGDIVTYQVEVVNVGGTDLEGLSFTDDLSRVLAHASYRYDAAATAGTETYAESVLTWRGDVAQGGSVAVTYSVRLDPDATADTALHNVVVGDGPGSNCPPGSSDSLCISVLAVTIGGGLPHTGAYLLQMAATAVALILAGQTLLHLSRRRREGLLLTDA